MSATRNVLKALPLGVALPLFVMIASVPPEEVPSNISKWLLWFRNGPFGSWLALYVIGFVCLVYGGLVWGLPYLRRVKKHDVEQKPSPTNLPPIGFASTVEGLQLENGVRELTNSENDLSLYQLPNGVMGWVESYELDSPTFWVQNAFSGSDFLVAPSVTQLRKSKSFKTDVEIHKDQYGIVRILAYINESTKLILQDPKRSD